MLTERCLMMSCRGSWKNTLAVPGWCQSPAKGYNRMLTEQFEHVRSGMLQFDWDMFDAQSERETQSGVVQGA